MATEAQLRARRPSWRRALPDQLTGWAFTLPASAIVLGLALFPVIYELVLSTKVKEGFSPERSAGLANYRDLVGDPDLHGAAIRSLQFLVLYVPLTVLLGLGLALLLNQPLRGMGIYRTCMFVPFVASAAATGIVFRYVLDPQYGVINNTLAWVGLARQPLLEDPDRALWVLVPIAMWSAVGFDILAFLAALQDVPPDLAEAARIDGAGRLGVFRHVTLPALRPITVLVVVWEVINGLQVFDVIYTTTRGGPLDSTTTLVYYAWSQAFATQHFGRGAAVGAILFASILLLTIAQIVYARWRKLELA